MKNRYENLKTYEEINEGAMGGSADIKPDQTYDIVVNQPYFLSKDLFKTGSSEVNKKSQQFIASKNSIMKLPSGDTILVRGLASLVGVGKGNWTEEKNKELAKKRAENFVKALKEEGADQVNYKIDYEQSTDTRTAKAGSQEALQSQSVIITRFEKTPSQKTIIARDNTATVKPKMLIGGSGKTEYFVLKFTYDAEERKKDPKYYSKMVSKLTELANSNRCSVTDITKWYSENK